MALPNITEIKKCPHCGSTEGYERTYSVKGTMIDYVGFDGSYLEEQSDHMFDHVDVKSVHKFVHCLDCKERIARNDRL